MLAGHAQGKIGAENLAEPATVAPLVVGQVGAPFGGEGKGSLGAKGSTNTALLAPPVIENYPFANPHPVGVSVTLQRQHQICLIQKPAFTGQGNYITPQR